MSDMGKFDNLTVAATRKLQRLPDGRLLCIQTHYAGVGFSGEPEWWISNVSVGRPAYAIGRPDESFSWENAVRSPDTTANGYGTTADEAERAALDALCADTSKKSASAATLAADVWKVRVGCNG